MLDRLRGIVWGARRLTVLVFAVTFISTALWSPQFMASVELPTGDEPYYLLMAHSLVYDGDINLQNNYDNLDYWTYYPKVLFPLHESKTVLPGIYSKHGLGLAVLIAPAYRVGGWLGTVLFMNFLAGLLAANVFLLSYEATRSRFVAIAIWLALCFTNPILSYSFLIFPAVVAALLITYGFRRALALSNTPLQAVGAGLCIGLLPWLNAQFVFVSAGLALVWLMRQRRQMSALATAAAPVAILGALDTAYYWTLYRTILPNYADHAGSQGVVGTLAATVGLLLDQQWGLLIYAPVYILAGAGLLYMLRRRRRDLLALAIVALPYYLFIANYRQWWGEWCPAARYLTPITPLAAIPLSYLLLNASGALFASLTVVRAWASWAIMGAFALLPKLMYNHPFGESVLFQWVRDMTGLDVVSWLPSFVVPESPWRQAALAIALCAVVAALVATDYASIAQGVRDRLRGTARHSPEGEAAHAGD